MLQLLSKIQNLELIPEAHAAFSPPFRPELAYEEIMLQKPKIAAINILLYLKDNEWHFPLIVRSENERDKHSGQIALPGGKKEPADTSLFHTASRETFEEVGVNTEDIRIVREISPVYVPPSNFYVHAFISYTRRRPQFYLQQSEASSFIEFPLKSILLFNLHPEMEILPTTQGLKVPVLNFNGYKIWGATAMVLAEFCQLVRKLSTAYFKV